MNQINFPTFLEIIEKLSADGHQYLIPYYTEVIHEDCLLMFQRRQLEFSKNSSTNIEQKSNIHSDFYALGYDMHRRAGMRGLVVGYLVLLKYSTFDLYAHVLWHDWKGIKDWYLVANPSSPTSPTSTSSSIPTNLT